LLGDRLRQLREQRNESKADVGRAVGVTGQAIGRYESNQDQPGGLILAKLARHYGVSVAYLVGETDDPIRGASLSPDWERVIRSAITGGLSPADVERAIRLLRAIESAERQED